MNYFKYSQLFDQDGDLSKRWYVGYYFKHPETGKYVLFKIWLSQKLLTKQARRAQANKLCDDIDNRLRQGFNPFTAENIGLTTVISAINKALDIKTSFVRYRTVISYKSYVKVFVDWLIESKLSDLTTESINSRHAYQYMDYLKLNKHISNRTYNNYILSMKALFNVLVNREYMLRNPFKPIQKLPSEERNIFAYSKDEIKLLKDYCIINDPSLWLFCQFIYYCAIRPNELTQLQISHINLDKKNISIPSYISKNKKQSVVTIPESFINDLKKLELQELPPEYYLFSKDLLPGEIKIFPTRAAERFHKVAKAIGLKRRMYDLKHTGAGMVLEAGVNIHDLQLHLRHSDLKITNEYLKAFKSQPSEDFRMKFPSI